MPNVQLHENQEGFPMLNAKTLSTLAFAVVCCASTSAHAQLSEYCSQSPPCVFSSNTGGYAIWGDTGDTAAAAVVGANSGSGISVWGDNTGSGQGVHGQSNSGEGVYGGSNSNNGIEGYSELGGGSGVYGHNSSSTGIGTAGAATGSGYGIYGDNTTSGGYAGYFHGDVKITGALTCGSGCSSDRRLKQNIQPLTGALGKLLQLKGVTFEWKAPAEHQNHKGTQTGVIAQDVEKVFPQWVGENDDGFKTVDPDARALVGLTVEGFRELSVQNDELRTRSAVLESRVKSLEAGRRPLVSGFGEGGIGLGLGLGLFAIAGTVSRRKRSEQQS